MESALELTVNENSYFFKEYSKAKSTGRAESSTLPASATVSPHSQLQRREVYHHLCMADPLIPSSKNAKEHML